MCGQREDEQIAFLVEKLIYPTECSKYYKNMTGHKLESRGKKNKTHGNGEVKLKKHAAKSPSDILLGEFFQVSTNPEESLDSIPTMKLQMENSRRNLDILFSGTNFLKGNRYELSDPNTATEDLKTPEPTKEKPQDRYFTDKSTIRCRKCKEFGHMSMNCPNEAVTDRVCIYCADPTHEQFDCPNRLCFKCNQKGHKAYECREINPKRCFRCEQAGHKAEQCTIIPPPITSREQQKMVCMQCRRQGHAMCDVPKKLRVQWAIVQDYKDAKKVMMKKLQAANEDIMIAGDGLGLLPDEERISDNKGKKKISMKKFEELREKKKRYKKAEKRSNEVYCCYCGDRHYHTNCRTKSHTSSCAHDMNIRRKKDTSATPEKNSKSGALAYEQLFEKYRGNNNRVHKRGHFEDDEDTDHYNDRVFREMSKGSRYHKKSKY